MKPQETTENQKVYQTLESSVGAFHTGTPILPWIPFPTNSKPRVGSEEVRSKWPEEGLFEFVEKVQSSWPRKARHAWCCMLANPQHLNIERSFGGFGFFFLRGRNVARRNPEDQRKRRCGSEAGRRNRWLVSTGGISFTREFVGPEPPLWMIPPLWIAFPPPLCLDKLPCLSLCFWLSWISDSFALDTNTEPDRVLAWTIFLQRGREGRASSQPDEQWNWPAQT